MTVRRQLALKLAAPTGTSHHAEQEPEQLRLEQPLPHPFADLGTSRCEHESVRGNRCTASGEWDGLSGRVLCDDHANGVDS